MSIIDTPLASYSYDVIGRISGINDIVFCYLSDSNLLSEAIRPSIVNTTCNYDANGNMLTNGTWSYTWNGENSTPQSCLPALTELGTFGGNLPPKASGTLQRSRLFGASVRLTSPALFTPPSADNATYYYQIDGNKNVTELTDASGAVVAHYEYSPFGSVVTATGTYAEDNPFRFSSEYYDSETGLVYYNYRYYSPNLSSCLKPDPIMEKGGWNLYAMVRNNPPNYFDNKGKSGLAEGLASGWVVAIAEPSPVGEVVMAAVTVGIGVGIGVHWLYDAITGDDAKTKADERLYPNRKRKRNEGQCDCNLRPVNNCDPPDSCPSFVTAWGVTRADCQKNARTLLAAECKKFLGHCQFRSASVLP